MSYLGNINYNNFGSKMEIIEYRGYDDIDIYFEEYNYIVKNRTVGDFKKGKVSCPYERRVCNVGYFGELNYKDNPIAYKFWENMIRRCYDGFNLSKHTTYIGCIVCEEWQSFENFTEWFNENYYEIEGEKMCLDKDILVHGNKIYSPSTCIFVPQRINTLFVKKDMNRGDLPIGVHWDKSRNKYKSTWRDFNSKTKSKRFNTIQEAFDCYKYNKEKIIKQVADKYKPYIPKKLYDAMYNYEVEITD